MAQLSRPYQIGLGAVALLAAVWLLLIQGHSSSSPSTSASVPAAVTTTTTTPAPAKASHSSAPGVAGLTRAIEKAHGAVSESQANAKRLEEKSAAASSQTSTSSPSVTGSKTSSAAPAAKAVAPSTTSSSSSSSKTSAAPNASSRLSSPTGQRDVEAQLKHGKIALVLFWDPKGSEDMATHRAVQQLSKNHSLDIAVNEAPASHVAAFGTITRGVQVSGTPTLLVINRKGEAIKLTGLLDAFGITQAIQEARHS